MSGEDFAVINALQTWSSWRTIPKNLTGRLPDRPVTAIDLCSGIGDSTAVLAYYCPPGSRLLGLEYNRKFVEQAIGRVYAGADANPANVRFRVQNVLDEFRDDAGARIPDESVDLVNACGAIGCHFDVGDLAVLVRECARVLRAGGLATLDTGPQGAGADDLVRVFRPYGFVPANRARSCFLDRRPQLCLQKSPRVTIQERDKGTPAPRRPLPRTQRDRRC